MKDISNICKGCMKHSAVNGKCPECGFDEAAYTPKPHHLKPGTILAGKYMIGKKLGEGGFGITYIGIDLNLGLRVAIKEYFPVGCVTRDTGSIDTITVFDGETRTFFEHGRDKFIEEARTIAQLNESEGVVSVRDFFLENGTAYIVMEYLDGETLSDFLKRKGGKVSVSEALNMIKPILGSLAQLHEAGLIHRDISPDNIMITKTGKVKLIDFGAARDINPQGNRSLSIQLKPGYAPEEQYRTHGEQGPWTDVYALCATVYRMITGRIPEEANERIINDKLTAPSESGVKITPKIEKAIMSGMSIRAQDRIKNISELYKAFYNAPADYDMTDIKSDGVPAKRSKIKAKAVIIVAAAVIVAAAAVAGIYLVKNSGTDTDTAAPTDTVKDVVSTDESSSDETNGSDDAPAKSVVNENGVTMEQFDMIEIGMSYDDVVKILGSEGTVTHMSSGTKNLNETYEWEGLYEDSKITVSLVNKTVKSKYGYELTDDTITSENNGATIEKYNQITLDMPEDQMFEIMKSNGIVEYHNISDESVSSKYKWYGDTDNESLRITVEDGVVESKSQSDLEKEDASDSHTDLTMDKYNKLKPGMSYEEAVGIIGSEGVMTYSYESKSSANVSYKWNGENNEYIFLTMTDGALDSKSQSGLVPVDYDSTGNMTFEKFSQIKEGMSLDEVVQIAGEDGIPSYLMESADSSSGTYMWRGTEKNSHCSINFKDGKVSGMSQYNLR